MVVLNSELNSASNDILFKGGYRAKKMVEFRMGDRNEAMILTNWFFFAR